MIVKDRMDECGFWIVSVTDIFEYEEGNFEDQDESPPDLFLLAGCG